MVHHSVHTRNLPDEATAGSSFTPTCSTARNHDSEPHRHGSEWFDLERAVHRPVDELGDDRHGNDCEHAEAPVPVGADLIARL